MSPRTWSGSSSTTEGNGTGEVLLTTVTDFAHAHELAAAYHQRWEEETGNDQLEAHLRGPGRVLRSRLPDLVHQEIWAWLLVHHTISVLITRAAQAADIDPDLKKPRETGVRHPCPATINIRTGKPRAA